MRWLSDSLASVLAASDVATFSLCAALAESNAPFSFTALITSPITLFSKSSKDTLPAFSATASLMNSLICSVALSYDSESFAATSASIAAIASSKLKSSVLRA